MDSYDRIQQYKYMLDAYEPSKTCFKLNDCFHIVARGVYDTSRCQINYTPHYDENSVLLQCEKIFMNGLQIRSERLRTAVHAVMQTTSSMPRPIFKPSQITKAKKAMRICSNENSKGVYNMFKYFWTKWKSCCRMRRRPHVSLRLHISLAKSTQWLSFM